MSQGAIERLCFVISPIGSESKTPDRYWRARRVLENVIQPAIHHVNTELTGLPIHCERNDFSDEQGHIMDDVAKKILRADIVVAVLFEANANVFFELGMAQALGRSMICLTAQDYETPFDIGGDRHIRFTDQDLADDAVTGATSRLAGRIRKMLDEGNLFHPPRWLPGVAPVARVLPTDRFNTLSHAEWSDLLLRAEDEVWLAGISLWQILDPNFRLFRMPQDGTGRFSDEGRLEETNLISILETLYLAGRSINILTMDTGSLLDTVCDAPPGRRSALEKVRGEIGRSHALLAVTVNALAGGAKPRLPDAAARPGRFRVTRVAYRQLTHRVWTTEQVGYATPIFYSLGVNSGPSFRISPKSPNETAGTGSFGEICLWRQVRDDLKLHQRENGYWGLEDGERVSVAAQTTCSTGSRRSSQR